MSKIIKKGKTDVSAVIRITDATDGSPETGVVAATAGLVLNYRRDVAASVSLATITDLAADTTAHTDKGIIHMGDGYYRVDVPDAAFATGVDNVLIHGTVTGMIVEGAKYQLVDYDPNDAVALGLTTMPADVIQISGDTTAADNLEAQFDTTGLSGGTFPANQDQLSGIANTGSAVNVPASSYTLTTGTQSSGTVNSTQALDGVNHEHTDTAGAMELYYEFNVGAGIPSSVECQGYLNSANDSLEVYGYDWVATAWVQIGTMVGKNAAANDIHIYEMFVNMVGTGVNTGIVRLRFFDGAFTLTSATLAVDRIFVSYSLGVEGYGAGAVWLDTNASNTNTVVGVDGTARNPVSTIAAANTLLASTNLARLEIAPGSSITLAATQASQLFQGHGWTLALGGQDVDQTRFFDGVVTGVATAATRMEFHDCEISTGSFQKAHFFDTTFDGTATFTLAGDYHIINCQSGVAGAGAPVFTKTPAQAITAEFRRWSGGVTFSNIEAGDVLTIGGELGTVTLNGADGTVEIRGTYKAIVDNRTGSPVLNLDGAILGGDVADILVDTVEIGTAGAGLTAVEADVTKISGSASAADNLEQSAEGILPGTATGGTTTTVISTSISIVVDDQYNGRTIIFDGNITANLAQQATDITDTDLASNTLTVTALTTAPANGDTFVIV